VGAAHERLRSSRQNYLRATNGELWGKPANGVESKYLLTGMATCGVCGGGMLVYSRSHGKQRAFFYACPRARVDLCANGLEVPMLVADAAVLGMMADEVLSPEVIELALDKLIAMVDAPAEDVNAKRKRLTESLRKPERELANLEAAVAAGEPMETLLAGMRARAATERPACGAEVARRGPVRAGCGAGNPPRRVTSLRRLARVAWKAREFEPTAFAKAS
jgi:Recombinase zinc beta ribbon domain